MIQFAGMTHITEHSEVPTVIGEWELRCTSPTAIRKRGGLRSYEEAVSAAKVWAAERAVTSGETYDMEIKPSGAMAGTDQHGNIVYILITFVSKEPVYDY